MGLRMCMKLHKLVLTHNGGYVKKGMGVYMILILLLVVLIIIQDLLLILLSPLIFGIII